jgi:cyclopropane-fatty-acyl-phospholipid synthase
MLLARLCKTLIRDGALTLIDADGTTYRFGQANRAADIVVRLHDRSLHYKLAVNPYVYLGEAYVDGTLTVERGDVYELLDLCARSLERLLARPEARWMRVLGEYGRVARALGKRGAGHHDLPDVLYDPFLDWDQHDSCAYFADPRMTLEEAQESQRQHLAAKLLLRPGQKVLDVGSGWGGLALHLAETGGVDVTGITLSPQQVAVARQRAAEAALGGQVTFHLRDVRHETGKYDRVVSLGTLAQVGSPHYREIFGRLRDLLTDDGVAVVHAIGRMDRPRAALPWLCEGGSAGAYVPALSELLPMIERERLWVTDLEILRLHYAETLQHWRRRFVSDWERASQIHGDRFCRAWEVHLARGEAGFRHGGLMVLQIQLAKRADAVPLTREYMYEHAQTAGGAVAIAA